MEFNGTRRLTSLDGHTCYLEELVRKKVVVPSEISILADYSGGFAYSSVGGTTISNLPCDERGTYRLAASQGEPGREERKKARYL